MAPSFSIESYKRKQHVLAVKSQKRRISTFPTHATLKSKESYTADQRRYLNACIETNADPDPKLLMALQNAQFALKLDRFGKDELAYNMKFLQKTKTCLQILVSLGSVVTNRGLRIKFDRLGLSRAYAYEKEGAALVVRSACASAFKTPSLMRFHLIGVKISLAVVPLLYKALDHCHHLTDVSLSGSGISDKGLEAIAIALGKCPNLNTISLAGCNLTNKSKEAITKIIALHGVIKDEAVWSSSLRNQTVPTVSSPDLLIDLFRNNLDDAAAEVICDGLFNDKWLLGLNLGANNLSHKGTEIFVDTLTKRNRTLAVLALGNMKETASALKRVYRKDGHLIPFTNTACNVDIVAEATTLSALESILYDRRRYLQQVATESREKRMALGALLLQWGIDKDTIVEVCYLESRGKETTTKGFATSRTASKKIALTSPKGRIDRVHPLPTANNTCASLDDNNNQQEEEDDEDFIDNVTSTADSHVKTIEYLIERLSSLEGEKRRMQEYVVKIETENKQLQAKLETQNKMVSAPSISMVEAQIIAQLENSITSLAEQVEFMELKKQE